MKKILSAALAASLALSLPLIAHADKTQTVEDFKKEYSVGSWVSAPKSEQCVADMKDCGVDFTWLWYAYDDVDNASQWFEKYGIKYISLGSDQYLSNPNCIGKNIKDEPSMTEFDEINRQVLEYQTTPGNEGSLAFVNLLPSCGDYQLGTSSYGEYIEKYCQTFTTLDYLSFDIYPYSSGTSATYLTDLLTTSDAADRYGLDLWVFVQAESFYPSWATPTEAMFMQQMYCSAAFGANKLMLFNYGGFENSLMKPDGSKNEETWYSAQKMCTVFHDMGELLKDYTHTGTTAVLNPTVLTNDCVMNLIRCYDKFSVSDAVASAACTQQAVIGSFESNTDDSTVLVIANATELLSRRPKASDTTFSLSYPANTYIYENGQKTLLQKDASDCYKLTINPGYGAVAVIEPIAYIPGDVDLSGDITLADAMLVFSYIAQSGTLSAEKLAVADTDGNGDVTLADAMNIFGTIAKSI